MLVFTIKLLILIAALWYEKRIVPPRTKKKCFPALVISTLLICLFANTVANSVPTVTDAVTLTALGERNEAASAEEVFLSGYTVDGRTYLSGDSLRISDGKWFWIGENYCWRIESDPRQPAGTTRSITIQIPVGRERSLNFNASSYGGRVQISTLDNIWEVDTFSLANAPLSSPLPSSRASALVWNCALHTAVYALVFSALFFFMLNKQRWIKLDLFARKNWQLLSYGGIALVMLVFMCSLPDAALFTDEIYQVGYLRRDLLYAITVDPCTPPLFSLITYVWYRLIPYGEQYLLFICKLITAVGIFLLGVTGRRFFRYRTGLFAMLIGAFNYTLVLQCGHELRAYSTSFLLSVIVLYFFLLHIEDGKNSRWQHMTAYSVAIAFSAYNHYFGVFICLPLFLYDCILFARKKVNFNFVMPYFFAGLAFVPWLLFLLAPSNEGLSLTWQPVPNFEDLKMLYYCLCSNITLEVYLFFFAVIWIMIRCIAVKRKAVQDAKPDLYLPLVFISLALPIMMFLYANYFAYRSTFWCDRYFTCLIPYILLCCGIGIDFLLDGVATKQWNSPQLPIAILLVCAILLEGLSYCAKNSASYHDYSMKKSADWIYEQGNYIFNDTTAIITTFDHAEAWESYYIERGGRRDGLNVIGWDWSEEKLLSYDRIYLLSIHYPPSGALTAFLDQHYILEESHPEANIFIYQKA